MSRPSRVAPPPAVAEQVIARFQNNDVQTGGSGQSISDDSLTRQHVERASRPFRFEAFQVRLSLIR